MRGPALAFPPRLRMEHVKPVGVECLMRPWTTAGHHGKRGTSIAPVAGMKSFRTRLVALAIAIAPFAMVTTAIA